MQQLIYTSAPRLLESGKTGFGTVSCSRGIPKPLISYLERISTFDREAGVSSLDYYSCFRMGAARFHVFTRVSDAGADYTGRTNHLAQHFIVEDGTPEFALLAASTPAGVLAELGQLFLPSWNGQVGYLEGEIPPPAPQTGIYYAWQTCTGQADNARWLAASYYLDSCCLNADVSARTALELLHDGLLQRDDHGWGMGLSTAVVSNLSASAFPITFLGGEQRAVGVRAGAGAHLLSPSPALQPPTEADMPAVAAPAVDTPLPTPVPTPGFAPQPPLDVLPAPLPQPEVVPDFSGQAESHGSRRERGRGKGESQTIMLVGGLAVVALGFIAWSMTGNKEAPQPESASPTEQTPPPTKPKKKPQDLPTLPTVGGYPDIRIDNIPPQQPTEQPSVTPPNEQPAPQKDREDKGTRDTEPPQPETPTDTPEDEVKTPASQATEERGAAPDAADTAQKPQQDDYGVPEFGITGIVVTVIIGTGEEKFGNDEEILSYLDKKNVTEIEGISISVSFEGINKHIEDSLQGVGRRFSTVPEEQEWEGPTEEIKKAMDTYVQCKKKRQQKQTAYKKKKDDIPLKTSKPEEQTRNKRIEAFLNAEGSPNFAEAEKLLKQDKREPVKKALQQARQAYNEYMQAEQALDKAQKELKADMQGLFLLKETMKQRFKVSSPDKDGFIEVKYEIIETPKNKK